MKNLKSIQLLVLLVLVFFLGFQNYRQSKVVTTLQKQIALNKPKKNKNTEVTNEDYEIPAPEFTLLDKDNKKVALENLSNTTKKIVVFANEGCSFCDGYYSELNEFANTYKNIDVVLIKYGTDLAGIKKTMEEKKYNFKMLLGTEEVFENYEISSTPTTYFLDEKNNIITVGTPDNKTDLESLVFFVEAS